MKKKRSTSLLKTNPKESLGLLEYQGVKIPVFYMICAKNQELNVSTIIPQRGLTHQNWLNSLSEITPMLSLKGQNNHFIKSCRLEGFQQRALGGVAIFSKKIPPLMFPTNIDLWDSGQKKAGAGKDHKLIYIKMAIRFISQYFIGRNGKFGNTLKDIICLIVRFTMKDLADLGVLCVHLSVIRNPNTPNGFYKPTKTVGLRFTQPLNVP
jgi:hypothetical protein